MKPLALVIENDGGTRRLLDVLLSRSGLDVDLVSTGREALLLLAHARYDVLFVDLLLPGISGIEVLDWLASERPHVLGRAIVLSSAPEPQLQHVRDRWPEVRVVRKPFELGDVVETAQRVLAQSEARVPSLAEEFCRTSVRAGAKAGVIATGNRAPLEVLHAFGYQPGELDPYFPLALDAPMPLSAAVRTVRPVWLASHTAAAAAYPQLAAVLERNGSRALAALPLLRGEELVGAVSWSFAEPRLFTQDEQQVFLDIAAKVAQSAPLAAP